jgi:hypothetical protein
VAASALCSTCWPVEHRHEYLRRSILHINLIVKTLHARRQCAIDNPYCHFFYLRMFDRKTIGVLLDTTDFQLIPTFT